MGLQANGDVKPDSGGNARAGEPADTEATATTATGSNMVSSSGVVVVTKNPSHAKAAVSHQQVGQEDVIEGAKQPQEAGNASQTQTNIEYRKVRKGKKIK